METADFDYRLPPELIAQKPAIQRDQSRLLVLHRNTGNFEHRMFRDMASYINEGDVLVLNDSRVIPARLHGKNPSTGGKFEILLLEENSVNDWWAMMRPGKRARSGTQITLCDKEGQPTPLQCTVLEKNSEGHARLQFSGIPNIASMLETLGEIPLPPYITRDDSSQFAQDRDRYQTIFARYAGSVAAPTAGLHFTQTLLEAIRERGAHVCFLTLHVGFGTFAPVKTETISAHRMHEERFELSAETARAINEAKKAGRRVFAVGTSTMRVLETLATQSHSQPTPGQSSSPSSAKCVARYSVSGGAGRTALFIHPPYEFKIVDAMLTNFHLPRSTLLMLVSAFASPAKANGRDLVIAAYAEAIRTRFRFFSYGDAMLLL